MEKENLSILKIELRKKFIQLRQSIPLQRRKEASIEIQTILRTKGKVLSFYSFGSEIDLSLLNRRLVEEKRLLFPRIENGLIVPYQVFDLDKSLEKSFYGGFEPIACPLSKVSLSEISLILVPGLAFDSENFRLGYGKGHYDQFLKSTPSIETLGVGFKEQLIKGLLPRDPWDVPLRDLLLL